MEETIKMGKKTPIIDPNDNKFESITDMCAYYSISSRLYADRLKRGFTQRQALGIDKKPRKIGETFEEIAEKYGLDLEVVKVGTQLGLKISDMRKLDITRVARDHNNTPYRSFNSMCRHYNASPTTVKYRLSRGWTLGESLTGIKGIEEYSSDCELNTCGG